MVWGIIAAVIAVVASAGVYYQQKKMEAQAAKQAQEAQQAKGAEQVKQAEQA